MPHRHPPDLTVRDLLTWIDALAPFRLAEDWDNVGLLVGEHTAPVTRVLAALDLRDHVMEEAVRTGCDVILTHHPVVFPAISTVTDADAAGRLVLEAARRGIAVVAAHTNLDAAAGGLNDIMAALLGMSGLRPLIASEERSLTGLGRIGDMDGTLAEVVRRTEEAFGAEAVSGIAGDGAMPVTRVAVCTGSGGGFIDDARRADADVYITGDLKYHDADRAAGMGLVCAAHGAVETECLRQWITGNADSLGVPIRLAEAGTDPWWGRPA